MRVRTQLKLKFSALSFSDHLQLLSHRTRPIPPMTEIEMTQIVKDVKLRKIGRRNQQDKRCDVNRNMRY